VQGAKLPTANSADFVIIMMSHAKMPSLRHAAGNTHVEVNSGGAAVIARAVQAATNPTEGQRMLQAGFDGQILGGESRETTSTNHDIEGISRVDRVVQRSVVTDDRQMILVQQVQQSVVPNIEMVSKAELAVQMSTLVTKTDFDKQMDGWQKALMGTSSMVTDGCLKVIMHKVTELTAYADKHAANLVARMDDKMGQEEDRVDKNLADLEQRIKVYNSKQRKITDAKNLDNDTTIKDLDSKTDKILGTMKKTMRAQNEAYDTKDKERDAKDKERDAKDKVRDAKDKERDALIASLQRDLSKNKKRPADDQGEGASPKKLCKAGSKKRNPEWPADDQGEGASPKKLCKAGGKKRNPGWPTNISKAPGSNGFMWKKTIQKVEYKRTGFKTIADAVQALTVFLKNAATNDTTSCDED